uniref:Uncharacterized protein n=1 Tax=Panagrolaimus sp. JU765 TaxID=591449 RepID=A0AC34QFT3_9BILA
MTENPRVNKYCNHTDVFFKRHCATAEFMEQNKARIDYILFLDADIGIINPCHLIQDYIDDDKKIELTFYDRYYNDEIMAGAYLAR